MQISSAAANTIHFLALVAQVLNAASGVIPPKYQPIVGGVVAAIQLVVGRLQHVSPPPQ